MEFENNRLTFVYINNDYLRYLYSIDSEVMFAENHNYEFKPHVGILLNNNGYQYVIPLTSAKEKHLLGKDISMDRIKIFEIVDTRTVNLPENSIVTEVSNLDILNSYPIESRGFIKKRILSVLEIKKMIPVKEGLYTPVNIDSNSNDRNEAQRSIVMDKEYEFLLPMLDKIKTRAKKVYAYQTRTRNVMRFYCDFKRLETACDLYSA